ncbi:MAG: ATP-binding protein [Caulobacteraceae bacterium]|nr:ATP-binding protein [Caulobacteraceae bacterium]
MAFDLKSIRKNEAISSPRILCYGVPGIGKSTFGASAPNPIFICTEDGLGSLKVDSFPLAQTSDDVLAAIASLYSSKHEFRTVVIDSVDWLEAMIAKEIETKYDAKDLAYGRAAVYAVGRMREILDGLNALRNDKGMIVILIAHCQIRRFDSPEVEPYDRYMPKLQDKANAVVREWADAVLFCNYKTVVKKDDVGFNQTNNRGISTGERLLFTSEKPAYMAKNRYSMPESIPLSWDDFAAAIN